MLSGRERRVLREIEAEFNADPVLAVLLSVPPVGESRPDADDFSASALGIEVRAPDGVPRLLTPAMLVFLVAPLVVVLAFTIPIPWVVWLVDVLLTAGAGAFGYLVHRRRSRHRGSPAYHPVRGRNRHEQH